jgi:hypothetical protein
MDQGMDWGWIKLYRSLLDKPIWKKSTPEQKVILITLLLLANHRESEWEWQGHKFKVQPGQFVTSIESIRRAAGPGISTRNVRSALVKFEKYNFLTNQSTKTGRLITIAKWRVYQEGTQESDKESDKEVTKRCQRGDKEVTPNKNERMKEVYLNPNNMSIDLVDLDQNLGLKTQSDEDKLIDQAGDPVYGPLPDHGAFPSAKDTATSNRLQDKARLVAEFDAWWQDYPRKEARKEAETKYIALRRRGVTREDLEKAKQNYLRCIRAQGREKRFIMLGKTFLGPNERWREYLNDIEVASMIVGAGMAPVPTQAAYEQERAELEQFGGDYKKWWAWKKKQKQKL